MEEGAIGQQNRFYEAVLSNKPEHLPEARVERRFSGPGKSNMICFSIPFEPFSKLNKHFSNGYIFFSGERLVRGSSKLAENTVLAASLVRG
jgi:hypothetical protein